MSGSNHSLFCNNEFVLGISGLKNQLYKQTNIRRFHFINTDPWCPCDIFGQTSYSQSNQWRQSQIFTDHSFGLCFIEHGQHCLYDDPQHLSIDYRSMPSGNSSILVSFADIANFHKFYHADLLIDFHINGSMLCIVQVWNVSKHKIESIFSSSGFCCFCAYCSIVFGFLAKFRGLHRACDLYISTVIVVSKSISSFNALMVACLGLICAGFSLVNKTWNGRKLKRFVWLNRGRFNLKSRIQLYNNVDTNQSIFCTSLVLFCSLTMLVTVATVKSCSGTLNQFTASSMASLFWHSSFTVYFTFWRFCWKRIVAEDGWKEVSKSNLSRVLFQKKQGWCGRKRSWKSDEKIFPAIGGHVGKCDRKILQKCGLKIC